MDHRQVCATPLLVGAFFLFGGCSKSDSGEGDSTAASAAMTPVSEGTANGSMAGMDHSAMTATPAKDADQEFLRMMVDHHQGMLAMADTTLANNPSSDVRQAATMMQEKQSAEQKTMIEMLKRDYGEDKMPMVMPSNATMITELSSKSGADLDRAFRENVIAHHEEALKMVSDYQSRFTKADVRSMAARMKSEQQQEITKLRSELGRS